MVAINHPLVLLLLLGVDITAPSVQQDLSLCTNPDKQTNNKNKCLPNFLAQKNIKVYLHSLLGFCLENHSSQNLQAFTIFLSDGGHWCITCFHENYGRDLHLGHLHAKICILLTCLRLQNNWKQLRHEGKNSKEQMKRTGRWTTTDKEKDKTINTQS